MASKSIFTQVAKAAHQVEVLSRDAQAIKRGRVSQRVTNRGMGRAVSKSMKGLWR